MVSLGFCSSCNFNARGLSGWVAMTNLQTAAERYTCELKGSPPPQRSRDAKTCRDKENSSPRMTFQTLIEIAGGLQRRSPSQISQSGIATTKAGTQGSNVRERGRESQRTGSSGRGKPELAPPFG